MGLATCQTPRELVSMWHILELQRSEEGYGTAFQNKTADSMSQHQTEGSLTATQPRAIQQCTAIPKRCSQGFLIASANPRQIFPGVSILRNQEFRRICTVCTRNTEKASVDVRWIETREPPASWHVRISSTREPHNARTLPFSIGIQIKQALQPLPFLFLPSFFHLPGPLLLNCAPTTFFRSSPS